MPSISASRSVHLTCSPTGIALSRHSGASSAVASGGPKRSLTTKPMPTAATTARKPSTSWRATLDGIGANLSRGSSVALSTAAATISAAMKR